MQICSTDEENIFKIKQKDRLYPIQRSWQQLFCPKEPLQIKHGCLRSNTKYKDKELQTGSAFAECA